MPEHGVALTAGIDGEHLLVMCECGWHVFAPGVVTFDYVAELVKGHRDAAA